MGRALHHTDRRREWADAFGPFILAFHRWRRIRQDARRLVAETEDHLRRVTQ